MTNHLEIVQELQRKRYAMLLSIWKEAEHKEDLYVLVASVANERELVEAHSILNYLSEEDLVKIHLDKVKLTHKGIVEIEQSISHPQKATEHFHSQVIQHFYNTVGAVQNASDSNSIVNFSLSNQHPEICDLIVKLSEALLTLTPKQRNSLKELINQTLTQ